MTPLEIANEIERKITSKIGEHFSLEEYLNYLQEEYRKCIICEEKPLFVKGLIYECRDAYVLQINSALRKLSLDSFRATICHEGTHIERKCVPYYDYEYDYIKQNESLIIQVRARDGRYWKFEEDISECTASLLISRIQQHDETAHQNIPSNFRKVLGYKE